MREKRIKDVLGWFSIEESTAKEVAKKLKDRKVVFVFGANAGGIHGAGAAKTAKDEWGAKYRQIHRTGDAYGFVTTVDLNTIGATKTKAVDRLVLLKELYYLRACILKEYDTIFLISKIGCGLAGQNSELMRQLVVLGVGDLPNIIGPADWGIGPETTSWETVK